MTRSLFSLSGVALVAGALVVLAQASCSTAEPAAAAEEIKVSREMCSLGAIESVSRCGGIDASCHVCGRPETDEGVCLQPCTVGKFECHGAQRCVPIDGLEGNGYARVGDCPTGYCQ